jgi:hypothetical protein
MFMSIDGCSPATVLWEETIGVVSSINYTFSFWASKADYIQPNFEVHFIGNVTGDNVVLTQTGGPYTGGVWVWENFKVGCWNAGANTSVTIRVVNLETDGAGNDFGMDDFSFRRCCSSSYVVSAPATSGINLFTNGNFSAGNTGFTSGHTYTPTYSNCNYYVGPGWFSPTLNASYPDHTATTDNMFMSVDGCSPATVLWQQTVSVQQNKIYQFAFWATRADFVQPRYEIHFIGNVTGDVIVGTQTGIPGGNPYVWMWDQYGVSCWNSGNNQTVTVRVINLELNGNGNDFGMDDFSLRQCCNPNSCCIPNGRLGQVDEAAPANAFEVFPNPGNGNFEIQLNGEAASATAELFNLQGARIDAFTFSGTVYKYSPAAALPSGVYLLRITSNGITTSKRIVVE